MNLLALLTTYWRILLAALVLAMCVIVAYRQGEKSVMAAWERERLLHTAAVLSAERAARERENNLQTRLNEAQKNAAERETELKANADRARLAAGSLRDALAAARRQLPDAAAPACRATADTALALLGECAERYRDVAAAADGHASDAKTLIEAWPR